MRVAQNAALCPRTAALAEQVPGLISAFFSIHTPGTEIPEHRGVSKSIINCHLPLDVPDEREVCGIRIDGRDYGWQEGRTLIFDDTYPHSAWNRSDRPRVILLLQFRRPLHFPGSLLAGAFLGFSGAAPSSVTYSVHSRTNQHSPLASIARAKDVPQSVSDGAAFALSLISPEAL